MANKRYVDDAGNLVTQSNFPTTTPTQDDREVTSRIYEEFQFPGESGFTGKRLLFRSGQMTTQTEIDALYADATIDSIDPTSGPAGGGTDVTITGTNFRGNEDVAFGGTSATSVTVNSNTEIVATDPGGTSGNTVDVTVTDDSGPVTLASAFTYE